LSDNVSDQTENLVSKAVRSDKRIKAEDLVANELATAVLSEPMPKIRHSCEALMLLDERERSSAGISGNEEENAKTIYQLCQTLQNPFIDKFEDEHGRIIERSVTIPWQFKQKDASGWLSWLDNVSWKVYQGIENVEETTERANELLKDDKERQALYVVSTERCTIETFKRIKNQFVVWAMPRTARFLKKTIKIVSTSSFQAAMERIKGGSSSGGRRKG